MSPTIWSVHQIFYALSVIASFSRAYEMIDVQVNQPRDNAPLDYELAYTVSQLYGWNGESSFDKLTHSFIMTSCGANLSIYHTDPDVFSDAGQPSQPILYLNHGYPESSYIWRNVTPAVSTRVPVYVPDRPGYGLSTPCLNGSDEFTTAGALIEASNIIFGNNISVILAAHDRGARAMHRAAVSIDNWPSIHALGLWMADIVPIVEEYASFSVPSHSVNYFHWAFLPKAELATDVIMAYGGGKWATYLNHAGSGYNTTATALFQAYRAFDVYANFFNQVSVTNASVMDYTAGATVDYVAQVADQAAGRKIKMPTHVMYSHDNLAVVSGFNVSETWQRWIDPEWQHSLTTGPVCCGQGHFIVELAPDEAIAQLHGFMDRLGVASSLYHQNMSCQSMSMDGPMFSDLKFA